MAKHPKTYEMKVRPIVVEVNSERDSGQKYTVTFAQCDCPDFHYRHDRGEYPFCKHIVAAYGALFANLLK